LREKIKYANKNHHAVKVLFWIALFSSYILAMLPQDKVPELTPFGDKSNHFLAFAVLTILLLHAYHIRYRFTFAWMLFYGIFIEISQLFTVNRCSELLDVLADTIGIVIGIVLYKIIEKFYPK